MALTDKTRKILWGRSGNRCAVCRRELVVDATTASQASVVGEECHIVSGKSHGPRHDTAFPQRQLDEIDNRILLCRTHHKLVDDQCETYTVDVLRSIKENHEKWVASILAEQEVKPPLRIRRVRDNMPTHLTRLTSGRDMFAVLDGAHAYSFEHDELTLQADVDLISSFLQDAQDYGDLSRGLESGERVRAGFELSQRLAELEQAGFWVFGAQETGKIEGGVGPSSPWIIAILHVLRPDNPEILKVGVTDLKQQDSELSPEGG